jgi:hypothetical protein
VLRGICGSTGGMGLALGGGIGEGGKGLGIGGGIGEGGRGSGGGDGTGGEGIGCGGKGSTREEALTESDSAGKDNSMKRWTTTVAKKIMVFEDWFRRS